MFCQYCLSSEPYPLVGMQSTSFVYNGLLINYLDCFKQCKQLKIEDEHTAYICTTCIPVLTKEYTLKQLENDQTGFSVVSIKEEPGLNLDKSIETATINSRLAIKTDRTDLQITISVANSEKGSLKTESTIEAVSTPYEKVQFVVSEIKEEEELQIVDEVDCASFDLKTETELTFEYALDSAGNHIILQYQPVLYGSDEHTIASSTTQQNRKKHDRPKLKSKHRPFVNKKTKDSTNPDKLHECSQCEKSYASTAKLNRHKPSHSNSRDHQCDQCSANFQTKVYLKMHIRNVHPLVKFQCFYCSKDYKIKNHLKQHLSSNHSDTKNFNCDQCLSAFTSKKTLSSHLHSVHSLTKFECYHCSNFFNSKSNLIQHLRGRHFEGKFKCSDCEKNYSSPGRLAMHVLTHLDKKKHNFEKYECLKCSKVFNAKGKLAMHSLIHAESKNFHCIQCSGAFKSQSILRYHLKTKH